MHRGDTRGEDYQLRHVTLVTWMKGWEERNWDLGGGSMIVGGVLQRGKVGEVSWGGCTWKQE
jgi:hypothetical protein